MAETLSPQAGKLLDPALLVDVPRLVTAYFTREPDPANPAERVTFGTSGHRGSAFAGSFNENHILAVTQAVCLHRKRVGIDGPLFVGIDTHALSAPALASTLEVLAANGVETRIAAEGLYTPTPAISHAILAHNRGRTRGLADGIVITPSHNPPEDGGFKYNPPSGGPADTDVTGWVERAANEILADGLTAVSRIPHARALKSASVRVHDFIGPYVADLGSVLDLEAVRASGVRIGIDALGGAAIQFWQHVIDRYGIAAELVGEPVDPTFRFMPADWDGRIRMDCSSPHAMGRLVGLKDRFDVAFANDTDADRHGIVTAGGLMNPNHYLATAIAYLFANRPGWRADAAVGKTLVSSAIIDRVAAGLGRRLIEVPVGFKWFVAGLEDGSLGFGGEESAGASFLRRDGSVWTTDKDGMSLGLLAAEITARAERDPGALYGEITRQVGQSWYERIDAPATAAQKSVLKSLKPEAVAATELAGAPIRAVLAKAPGNGQAIGGIKLVTDEGWFAARPSGTEDVYKIYGESFQSEAHLHRIQAEAQELLASVFAGA